MYRKKNSIQKYIGNNQFIAIPMYQNPAYIGNSQKYLRA